MDEKCDILLLAGSAEARQIATALAAQGFAVRALKSEPPRGPNPMPVPYDVIPDLSEAQLGAAMRGVRAVVDASHGFDARMTALGSAVARRCGLPFVSLSRPVWDVAGHKMWSTASDVVRAMALIGPEARVFSATGWGSLPEYAGFPGACLMLRQTTRHDRPVPFDFVELVFGDPPFDAESEAALFRALGVDTLICRNLGGRASRPKLDAAAALGIKVILIDRPPMPEGIVVVQRVEDVLDWVQTTCSA